MITFMHLYLLFFLHMPIFSANDYHIYLLQMGHVGKNDWHDGMVFAASGLRIFTSFHPVGLMLG